MDEIKYFIRRGSFEIKLANEERCKQQRQENIEASNDKINLSHQYWKWLSNLRHKLRRRYYRSIWSEVSVQYEIFKFIKRATWEIQVIKVKCILGLIKKKIRKYPNEIRRNNSNQNRSICFWFNQAWFLLEHLVLNIRPDLNPDIEMEKEQTIDIIDIIVCLHLEMIFTLAIYSKEWNEIAEVFSYFGMADIWNGFMSYSRNVKTLQVWQQLNLFRASLLISNRDIPGALKYIGKSMDICFRGFFLLINSEDCLSSTGELSCKNKAKEEWIYRNFMNLILAYFERGICFEWIGNITKSIESYKQCRWFSMKFLLSYQIDFVKFMNSNIQSAFNYHDIIEWIKEFIDNQRTQRKKEEEQLKSLEANKLSACKHNEEIWMKIANGESNFDSKNLEKTLEKLIDVQWDSINYSPREEGKQQVNKTNIILSTTKLVNTLLSKDFKNVLSDWNKIELNNWDQDTINKINKKIEIINYRNKQLKEEHSTRTINIMKTNSNLNCYKKMSRNISMASLTTSYQGDKSHTRFKSTSNYALAPSFSLSHRQKRMWTRPAVKYSPHIIEKIKVDKNIFSKSNLVKRNYLQWFDNKEIKFHKKVLGCKRIEKQHFEVTKDQRKVLLDADNHCKLEWEIAQANANQKPLQNQLIRHCFDLSNIPVLRKQNSNNNWKKILTKVKTKTVRYNRNPFDFLTNLRNQSQDPDLNSRDVVCGINSEMIKKLNIECYNAEIKKKKIDKKKNEWNLFKTGNAKTSRLPTGYDKQKSFSTLVKCHKTQQ